MLDTLKLVRTWSLTPVTFQNRSTIYQTKSPISNLYEFSPPQQDPTFSITSPPLDRTG